MNYKDNKNTILAKMLDYLLSVPGGTEITISELFLKLYPEERELFDEMWLSFELLNDLEKLAKKNGLYIDMSKHDGLVEGLPCNLDFAVYQKKPGKKCPFCGNRDTAKILYGLPMFSEELEKDMEHHRIALGGCCISSMDPKYHCFSCDKAFGKPAVFATKTGIESYASTITEIKFERGGFFQGRDMIAVKNESDKYIVRVSHFMEQEKEREISKKEWESLIKRLYDSLFIHEWKKNYDNPYILDGEQWSLEIKLTGKRVRNIYGSNEYPPYWDELVRTFKKLEKTVV